MFGSKTKEKIEQLQWKVKSLEDQNRNLRDDLEKALRTLRSHVVAVKNQAAVSEDAILRGLPFDVMEGKNLIPFLERNTQAVVLDVRTLPEYASGYIPGAKHIPVDQLPFRSHEVSEDKKVPVVVYCASGARSEVACDMLLDRGFTRVMNLRGGVTAYPQKLAVPERQEMAAALPDDLETDNPDLANKVQGLLDEEINPGVASHGGRVSLVAVKENKVYLRFGGGCHGCGQVDATLKQGITVRLQEKIAGIKEVVDLTDHSTGENPYFEAAH